MWEEKRNNITGSGALRTIPEADLTSGGLFKLFLDDLPLPKQAELIW